MIKEQLTLLKLLPKLMQQWMKKLQFHFMLSTFIFFLTRYGWKVKKNLAHYTFKQKKFKKDFVIMNQILRQNAKTDVKKDFYKLINNSNFGYECLNNADNCSFSPIYDELEEMMYAKRY